MIDNPCFSNIHFCGLQQVDYKIKVTTKVVSVCWTLVVVKATQ